MNWKRQEQELVRKLNELGLEREVIHNTDKNINKKKLLGRTQIYLFTKPVWQHKKNNQDDSIDGFVAHGYSDCSVSEQHYSRRIGRVIATGRAIKNYEKPIITG